MDKQTLSNYGWIVICVLVLATLLAFATPFSSFLAKGFEATSAGFEFTSYQMTSDVLGEITPPSLEELQSRYKLEYYSSLKRAVDDINASTIGKNADRNKDDAVAGIYTDRGKVCAVLLKDNRESERITITADMIINLGGNTLSSDNKRLLWIETGNVTIDGRLKGSTVYNDSTDDARCLTVQQNANVQIKNGTYIIEKTNRTDGVMSTTILCRGKLSIDSATIVNNAIGTCGAIGTKGDYANLFIQNSTIKSHSQNGTAYVGINTNILTCQNCNIESSSDTNIAYGIAIRKYEDAVSGIVTTNIYNSNIKLTATKPACAILGSEELTTGAIINIENSKIEATSANSFVKLIYTYFVSSKTEINITKSDLIGIGNVTNSTSYGIHGNADTHINIDRSTILVNKHLEGTDVKNSIGISKDVKINNKYSTIFGTKAKIEQ